MKELKNDIKIINNFLPQSFADSLESALSTKPIWLYTPHTSHPQETKIDMSD